MEADWSELNPRERQRARFQRLLAVVDPPFESRAAAGKYRTGVERLRDSILLDNRSGVVPILPLNQMFPASHAGISFQRAMYDGPAAYGAWMRYLDDFDPDYYLGLDMASSGGLLDILGCRLYKWPGGGLSSGASYQCVDREWMKAEEYTELLADPSGFWLRKYLPRVFGALAGLASLEPLVNIMELPPLMPNLASWGRPEVQEGLQVMMAAGREAWSRMELCREFNRRAQARGALVAWGGMSKAPFDLIGDTLRGAVGMVRDMFKQPEMIVEAAERLAPLMVRMGLDAAESSGHPLVFMPLHRGDDDFMSEKQFEKLYWPSLKKVVVGLVEEGCVPLLFIEGRYDSRLDYLRDLPPGSTICLFHRTDLGLASEKLAKIACIGGGVPAATLLFSTSDEVAAHCRAVVEQYGPRGGFILAGDSVLDRCPAENLRAMLGANRRGAPGPRDADLY
ncbi:MAG: hypothetical protein V1816_04285 [Pseudomonadota bacterium]